MIYLTMVDPGYRSYRTGDWRGSDIEMRGPTWAQRTVTSTDGIT